MGWVGMLPLPPKLPPACFDRSGISIPITMAGGTAYTQSPLIKNGDR